LDRLEKEGLVSHTPEEQDTRPDRKVYYISPKGLQELAQWLQRPIVKTRALRDELFIKLLFLDNDNPQGLLDLIQQQTNLYMQKMTELNQDKYEIYNKQQEGDFFITDLLIDAGLFHAEADIRWLDHCETKLIARYKAKGLL
jgi:DNA-binding PadR family transcriptional regulator